MITTVYRLPSRARTKASRNLLIAHLSSITPDEAIERLSTLGVLAIPGPDPSSIVLVGYHIEVERLLTDLSLRGYAIPAHYRDLWRRLPKAPRRVLSYKAYLARKALAHSA